MTELNPPSWLQDGCYTAQNDRLVSANIVCVEGVAKGLGATVSGLDRVVTIAGGGAFIEGDNTPGQGMYSVTNVGTAAVAIPAPAGNPRIDLIVARVYDSQYLGTTDEWVIEVIQGTPSPVPNPPALPPNSIPLYQVQSNPGTTNVTAADLTDLREQYEFCPGGQYQSHSGVIDISTGVIPQISGVIYGTTFTRQIPDWGITPDELIVISEAQVGSGYGYASISAQTVLPTGTISVGMRYVQLGSPAAQNLRIVWQSVRIS